MKESTTKNPRKWQHLKNVNQYLTDGIICEDTWMDFVKAAEKVKEELCCYEGDSYYSTVVRCPGCGQAIFSCCLGWKKNFDDPEDMCIECAKNIK